MRLTSLLMTLGLISTLSFGQIPNAGFEFWATDRDSNLNPVGWETTNSYPIVNVEPVMPGCQGSYAMKVKTLNVGFPFPGVAILQIGHNFSQIPTRFSACVKSTIMPGDRAFIIVGLMRGDSVIALQDSCTFKIDSTINQFTTREFPIRVQSNLVPDSLVIIVASGLGSGQAGTELIVDEIAFGTGSAGVSGEIHPAAFALGQNYPNPFNPETVIRYSLIVSGLTTLKVYDVLGREVATLVNEVKTPGKYSVKWDARNAASGVYFYKLQSGSFVDVKKLAVLK